MNDTIFADMLAILSSYRRPLLRATWMIVIANALLAFNPIIFRYAVYAVDPTISSDNETLFNVLGKYHSSVIFWAGLLLFVALVATLFKYYMRVGFISVSRAAEAALRALIFDKLQRQSQSFFDRHRVGALMSRLSADINAYRDVLGPGIMYPVNFITTAIPVFGAMLFISVPLTLLSLIPVVLLPLIILIMRRHFYGTSMKVQESLADINHTAQQHYSGIRIDKIYNAEEPVSKLFLNQCRRLFRHNLRLAVYQGVFWPFLTMITRLATVIIVLATGYIILKGNGGLSRADFVAFMWLQSYLFIPVLMLGWILPVYERGRAAFDRLLRIYREPIAIENTQTLPFEPPSMDIQVKGATFGYEGAEKVLKGVSLSIKEGEFVGITGPIGAGKTTLLHLMARRYDVTDGAISVGGRDIRKWPLESLLQKIAVVDHSPFIFSRTLEENIRLSKPEGDLQEVLWVTDLEDKVGSLPHGMQTMVGERGVTLSGGEKARLSLARALYSNRLIYLFDDLFSSVDAETEKKIFDRMRDYLRGKTVLIVSHRTTVLRQMDQIIYMVGGRVVEKGTPRQLLERGEHYAALVELQDIGLT